MTARFRGWNIFIIGWIVFGWASGAGAEIPSFNQLVVQKAALEQQHGIRTLECFPFLQKIGFDEDQKTRVTQCLTGTQTLASALRKVPDTGLRHVGISTRFLRTGGFQTLLIRWDASEEEVVDFLKQALPVPEQEAFIKQVKTLKRTILRRFAFGELYCAQRISNEECLKGYTTLASIEPAGLLAKKQWSAVVLSDTSFPGKDPTDLMLKFDDSAEQIESMLRTHKAHDIWDRQRRIYSKIEEQYGKAYKRKLQAPNVFCAVDLTSEECLQGAEHLHQVSQNAEMQDRKWGEVLLNRHNTLVKDDYNVELRYDLSPDEVVKYFARKPRRHEVQRDVTLSEKLEKRVKNNSTSLRAVCDLVGLRSGLCVGAFENFIKLLKARRDLQVSEPWTDIMFIDGTQLARVNFALNSSSRNTYLYISAHSSFEEMERFLTPFANGDTQ